MQTKAMKLAFGPTAWHLLHLLQQRQTLLPGVVQVYRFCALLHACMLLLSILHVGYQAATYQTVHVGFAVAIGQAPVAIVCLTAVK